MERVGFMTCTAASHPGGIQRARSFTFKDEWDAPGLYILSARASAALNSPACYSRMILIGYNVCIIHQLEKFVLKVIPTISFLNIKDLGQWFKFLLALPTFSLALPQKNKIVAVIIVFDLYYNT